MRVDELVVNLQNGYFGRLRWTWEIVISIDSQDGHSDGLMSYKKVASIDLDGLARRSFR